MAKRTSKKSQDYFTVKGGETGRRTYASERQKLKKASVSARVGSGATKAPKSVEHGVAATGAGAATVERGKKRQSAKSKKQQEDEVRGEEVSRMVEAQVPSAAPGRMLPPARATTELGDFVRITRRDLDTLQRAARELFDSLADLTRTPARLWNLLRTARARA